MTFPSATSDPNQSLNDRRLIERWLPITELGIESLRECPPDSVSRSTPHLVGSGTVGCLASRSAGFLLPEDADRERFSHAIGIHGGSVAAKRRIEVASRRGERLGAAAYGYVRAFKYLLTTQDFDWLTATVGSASVLDPTAGAGSVPFESVRPGFETAANDLNPVAVVIELATVDWPMRFGWGVKADFEGLGRTFVTQVSKRLQGVISRDGVADTVADGYLWLRTITCPYCECLVPLSPNWRLAPGGIGVRLVLHRGSGPSTDGCICSSEIIRTAGEQSAGTVARGDGGCPFGDCGRVIDRGEIKREARDCSMGKQFFTGVYKRRVKTTLKSGKRGRDF